MDGQISHGFEYESWEQKVAWFRTLKPADRLRHLDEFYRLAVGLNPKLRAGRDAEYPAASVRILELPAG